MTVTLTSCATTETEKTLLEPVDAAEELAYCERGDIVSIKVSDASIEGDHELLSFDRDGYLYEVFSSPGDKVGKGDVIAALTSYDFEELINLEDEIEALKESEQKKKDYYEARIKLKEVTNDDSQEEALTSRMELALMELVLSQKEARLEKLKEDDIGYNYITATHDGYIVATSSASEGAYVTAGTPIAALAHKNEGKYISSTYVSEKQALGIDSFYAIINGKEYPLRYAAPGKDELASLSAAGLSPSSRFEFVDEPGEEVVVGGYAAVIAVKGRKENVLTIPINAVFTEAIDHFVYVCGADGKKEKRSVTLGLQDEAHVEVVSGVEEGECVYVIN